MPTAFQEILANVKQNTVRDAGMYVQKAHEVRAKFGDTKVILSFGSGQDGSGALFAQWLREQLLTRFGWRGEAQQNSVYLDTVALSRVPFTRLAMRDVVKTPLPGYGEVGTAGGLASMNPGWHWYYMFAINDARVMIFAVTPAWEKSKWCKEEFEWFRIENLRRKRDGEKPLRGIALRFPGASPIAHEMITNIAVEQKFSVSNPIARAKLMGNQKNLYGIENTALEQVYAVIQASIS